MDWRLTSSTEGTYRVEVIVAPVRSQLPGQTCVHRVDFIRSNPIGFDAWA